MASCPNAIAYAADHVLHTADFARFGFVAGIVEVVEAGLILLLYLVFVLFAQSGDLGDDLRIVLVELAGSGDFRFIRRSALDGVCIERFEFILVIVPNTFEHRPRIGTVEVRLVHFRLIPFVEPSPTVFEYLVGLLAAFIGRNAACDGGESRNSGSYG